MSTASQTCLHVDWETKLGPTIAQSKLALSYFHLEYLVLFSKTEPNPFSPSLPMPQGRKVMLCLPPSSGRLCNWHQALGVGQPCLRSLCGLWRGPTGKRPSPRAGFPPTGWREGKEGASGSSRGASLLLDLSPGPQHVRAPLSMFSPCPSPYSLSYTP